MLCAALSGNACVRVPCVCVMAGVWIGPLYALCQAVAFLMVYFYHSGETNGNAGLFGGQLAINVLVLGALAAVLPETRLQVLEGRCDVNRMADES